MISQAQGKGKKKNKDVTKIPLEVYNSIQTPHGHSVVNLKTVTGLDWAKTMADHDQQAAETQQIIVPTAPRAQRGPTVDIDSIPDEPPFRVSIFNLPMSVEEREIRERFFQGLQVTSVDISSKSSTTVEFETKNDLYEALCKDGSSLKGGRTVSVCLFGQTPQSNYGSDRFGGRGGGSYSDRYGERGQSGYGGRGMGDRYGDRYGDRQGDRQSGFNRDRDAYGSGFNRGGFNQQRGPDRFADRGGFRDGNRGSYTSGGGEANSEEPMNWRARPAMRPPPPQAPSYDDGPRQSYSHPRSETSHNYQSQPPSYYHPNNESYPPRGQQYHNQPPNSSYPHHNHPDNRPSTSDERPKLLLLKRKTPLNSDDAPRNEAIFGQAKPTSKPYQKMNEIEVKLSSVQISEKKAPSQSGSQAGSISGSAPRSRKVSSNHSESNS